MSRLVIDMNLSVEWASVLAGEGHDAVHRSTIGDPRAADITIMAWARTERRVVFTHDLDFSMILALTHANGPSVLQVRGTDVLASNMSRFVLPALRQHKQALEKGAIVVVDERRARARVLPL